MNQFLNAPKKRVLERKRIDCDALINETGTEDFYSIPVTFSRHPAFTRSTMNENHVTKKGFPSLKGKALLEKNNEHSSFNEVHGV